MAALAILQSWQALGSARIMSHQSVANLIGTSIGTKLTARLAVVVMLGSVAMLLSTCNPFAPALDTTLVDRNTVLGDRKSINGLFQYFRNTYELRDSLLYGRMIARDFRFSFFDFSNNNLVYWDRDQEMQATYKMFRSVKSVSLIWNNYVTTDTLLSDTLAQAQRYFNLVIVQDDQNIFRGTGYAQLTFYRRSPSEEWQIRAWNDRSDF